MANKPSIPKGTRDFTPEIMVKRNYIFDTVKSVFQTYGYSPIETPAMENLSTLMGKYGEEGDKLLFKIQNSGEVFEKTKNANPQTAVEFQRATTEKGLRYDLTVPFARFVVQNQQAISFPFKRYQIQPVWRADRPQKGRYREFYQCDVDVVGSDSLLYEVELMQIVDAVFAKLNVNVTIKLNNRKILAGIAEVIGEEERMVDITVAIDKLDKIGLDNVNSELIEKGLSQEAVAKLQPILSLSGNNEEKIAQLRTILSASEIGMKGVEEVEFLFSLISEADIKSDIVLDLTLARGLNYYTGAIFEIQAKDFKIGSISGGGRYDNLTGIFGMKGLSGVGVSFGADRIFDVMEGLDLFPKDANVVTQVLFVNFGEKEMRHSLPLLTKLRQAGINAEIYPDAAKMKKQFSYANNKGVPYVVIIGDEEMKNGTLMLKDMEEGTQEAMSLEKVIEKIKG